MAVCAGEVAAVTSGAAWLGVDSVSADAPKHCPVRAFGESNPPVYWFPANGSPVYGPPVDGSPANGAPVYGQQRIGGCSFTTIR